MGLSASNAIFMRSWRSPFSLRDGGSDDNISDNNRRQGLSSFSFFLVYLRETDDILRKPPPGAALIHTALATASEPCHITAYAAAPTLDIWPIHGTTPFVSRPRCPPRHRSGHQLDAATLLRSTERCEMHCHVTGTTPNVGHLSHCV